MVTIQLKATVEELQDFVVVIAPNLLEAYQEIGVPFGSLLKVNMELARIGATLPDTKDEDEEKLRASVLKTLKLWEDLLKQIPDTEPAQG